MERIINTKFFTFPQNNSGGYFVENKENGVGEYVIIEAINADDAWNKLDKIGCDVYGFWSYCPCCGERWYRLDDDDGEEIPYIYNREVIEDNNGKKYVFIHYFDGTIKKVKFNIL